MAGWGVEIEVDGQTLHFHVLIDGQFPYSAIRVAYRSQEVYLRWPHVERGGVLCLPRIPAPSDAVEAAIQAALENGLTLVKQCQDAKFVEEEFRREFLSYWSRSTHPDVKRVHSLLDLSNRATRQVAVWYGQDYTLVGETPDQVRSWLTHRGRKEPSTITAGVFGFLRQAPVPPFPDRPVELFALLQEHCPDVHLALARQPIDQSTTIVLGAGSPTGDGLIAMSLSAPSLDGFRKKKELGVNAKFLLWKSRSRLKRTEVDRYDAAWVHGRGLNMKISALQAANVLVIGCGSLGSQVAARLAQSGVGGIILVDPDLLAPANVGRHFLGIDSVGKSKAKELARELRVRFPHIRSVEGRCSSWQEAYEKTPTVFENASLIVACLGEWSADGQLGEWQVRTRSDKPVVYGWLDERGTAAHALALTGIGPVLSCTLDPRGGLRVPETLWKGDGLTQAEPACGTLFQPYGAIDVAFAEALVSRLCIDALTGKAHPPMHRVYAGTNAQLVESDGEWSPEHLKHRPKGFIGAFEYERPVSACGICTACLERA